VGTETVLSRIHPPRRTYHPTVGAAVKNFERIIRAQSPSESAEPETVETRFAGPVVLFHPGHPWSLPAIRCPPNRHCSPDPSPLPGQ
jgi:hypothetical protein